MNHLECKLCNIKFKTGTARNKHILSKHLMTYKEYVIKVFYDGIWPKCKCGCGTELKFGSHVSRPWFAEYTKNHFPRKKHLQSSKDKIKESVKNTMMQKYGVSNLMLLKTSRDKIKQTKLEKYGDKNYNNIKKNIATKLDRYNTLKVNVKSKSSKYELDIAAQLNAEYKFIYKGKEFDVRKDNYIIEIDGDYFHSDSLKNLSFIQLSTIINDYEKIQIIDNSEEQFKLLKIKVSTLTKNESLESLISKSYLPEFSLNYRDIIIPKKYFESYINKKGKDKLKKYSNLLLKCLRTFQKDFPKIETDEILSDILNTIKYYNLSRIKENNIFKNNISNIGTSYLKSNFNSYWNSKYSSNKLTPVEAWNNDEIMKKVIEYRMGCNNSNELFDFSLHQMVKGLSANRFTISFFKPLLAAAIYYEFLGNKETPVVLDPCAGFGGRMLGFKAKYPNGTYIGVEPNPDTYKELVELGKNFSNIYLYNCKYEDFDISNLNYDLAFTSIPYYDLEIYSNSVTYNNFNEWKNTFLNSIKNTPNIVVNIPQNLRNEFDNVKQDYFLKSNTSHFNKGENTKIEHILVL